MSANGDHQHGTYEAGVALKDGTSAWVRPVRPDDGEGLREMLGRLSERSLYMRYHHHVARITDEDVRRYIDIDYSDRFALVAEHDRRIIGVVFYARLPGEKDRTELAITVEDEHQGLGIGPCLVQMAARAASDHGATVLEGSVLGSNERAMRMLRSSRLESRMSLKYGEVYFAMPLPGPDENEEWQALAACACESACA